MYKEIIINVAWRHIEYTLTFCLFFSFLKTFDVLLNRELCTVPHAHTFCGLPWLHSFNKIGDFVAPFHPTLENSTEKYHPIILKKQRLCHLKCAFTGEKLIEWNAISNAFIPLFGIVNILNRTSPIYHTIFTVLRNFVLKFENKVGGKINGNRWNRCRGIVPSRPLKLGFREKKDWKHHERIMIFAPRAISMFFFVLIIDCNYVFV